jgi:hypothetical protein
MQKRRESTVGTQGKQKKIEARERDRAAYTFEE